MPTFTCSLHTLVESFPESLVVCKDGRSIHQWNLFIGNHAYFNMLIDTVLSVDQSVRSILLRRYYKRYVYMADGLLILLGFFILIICLSSLAQNITFDVIHVIFLASGIAF